MASGAPAGKRPRAAPGGPGNPSVSEANELTVNDRPQARGSPCIRRSGDRERSHSDGERSRVPTTSSGGVDAPASAQDPCAGEVNSCDPELERAQAAEAQVRDLLSSATSFFSSDDIDAVFAELARSAVAHLGLAEVSVYRTDHEKAKLVGVIRAVATGERAVRLEALSEEIDAGSGHFIAEFARGRVSQHDDRGFAVIPSADSQERVLVRMAPAVSRGVMVGVVSARAREGHSVSDREVELLRDLVSLAAGATEQARIEQLRRQLVSSVSHELRTPLASIRAYNELLADGDAGPVNDEQKLFLQRIETMTGRLERLVDDLLDLSRLRAGELSVHKSPVDVAAVIDHTINALQPEAISGGVELTSTLEPDLPLIYTDPDRLSQVLFNLAGNAVKYVGANGVVQVRAKIESTGEQDGAPNGSRLVISVTDNGPGIVPEDLDKIFDEFQRGRGAEGVAKGAGLGLSIAARLTRLLGGEIGVHSELGTGSTFYLRFPMRAVRLPE